MRGLLLVARRDLQAYFNTAWGYVILAAMLLIDGLLFNAFAMGASAQYSSDVLEKFFYLSSGITMAGAVILTMRLFGEERSAGTMVLLDTAPLTDLQIVLGKFLAGFAMIAILLGLTLYMPALIFVNGKVSLLHIASGYLGLLALGATVTAIGTWGSAVTRGQYVGAGITAVVTVALLLTWMLAKVSDPPLKAILSYVALFDKHFQPFQKGRINIESLVYYASLTFAFLVLAVRGIQGRRWR
ncbi:MAG: ABC transporter permease subunit [Deltaproteobacteria bacterium]|nr:ABC transporter permease subunit [Deltaproteobacteria bacterium]